MICVWHKITILYLFKIENLFAFLKVSVKNISVQKSIIFLNLKVITFAVCYMIRKALSTDLDIIIALTKECARAMIALGIYQWNEHYPNRSRFEKDIDRQELYVLEEKGHIKGIVVLTEIVDEEYLPISWLTDNHNNLYIHRLAVHPNFWGKGYAQQLMDYAENYALENNFKSIRLDTFSQNKRNQKFYETRGYQQLGNIYFPKQSDHPFYCYELVL